jgi:hypothetical protein
MTRVTNMTVSPSVDGTPTAFKSVFVGKFGDWLE